MINDKERVQKAKELIRFFLNQAINNLEQAKMQCLFIHPNWQNIEGKIQETISLATQILEASQRPDEEGKSPFF